MEFTPLSRLGAGRTSANLLRAIGVFFVPPFFMQPKVPTLRLLAVCVHTIKRGWPEQLSHRRLMEKDLNAAAATWEAAWSDAKKPTCSIDRQREQFPFRSCQPVREITRSGFLPQFWPFVPVRPTDRRGNFPFRIKKIVCKTARSLAFTS